MTTPRKIPITLRSKLLRLGIGISLTMAMLYLALVWWCAKEIAEPSRRLVEAQHLPYFDGSAKAGFVVEKFVSSDGMPCLVCTPERVDEFSKRAGIIREQLAEQGISLKPARNTTTSSSRISRSTPRWRNGSSITSRPGQAADAHALGGDECFETRVVLLTRAGKETVGVFRPVAHFFQRVGHA